MALSFVIFPGSYSILCAALVIGGHPGENGL
jgi:hypothetical protein